MEHNTLIFASSKVRTVVTLAILEVLLCAPAHSFNDTRSVKRAFRARHDVR